MNLIRALNALNQPWVAILVILIGMGFDILCKHYGVSNDAATGVIGAGVGLLTGQGLHAAGQGSLSQTTTTTTQEPPKETPHV